jgi:nudix motif 8
MSGQKQILLEHILVILKISYNNHFENYTIFIGKVAVMPVLGFAGDLDLKKLQVNQEEVEAVFAVSLELLCDPSVSRHTQFRSRSMVLPVYHPPGQRAVWGLTAVITHLVLKALAPKVYKKQLRAIAPLKIDQ